MRKPLPRNPSRPASGCYAVRLVSKGWPVPVMLMQDGDGSDIWIDGAHQGFFTWEELSERVRSWVEGNNSDDVTKVLLFAVPITAAEYAHKLATREWALSNDPRHPAANPRRPIDMSTLKPDEF